MRFNRTVRSEIVSEDKKTGKTTHYGEKRKIERATATQGTIGLIKVSTGVSVATGYQSVRLDVGVELPWPCRPGKPEDLQEGFESAYELVSKEMADRSNELDELVRDLARKYKH